MTMRVAGSVFLLAVGLAWPGAVASAQVERDLTEVGWEVVEAPEPGTPEEELHLARQALAEGRYADARRRMDRWIKEHKNHDLEPEAHLIRGDALFEMREHYRALYDYEYIARMFPGSEAFNEALEREYEIAMLFASGVRRKLWGLRWLRAYDEAEELLIRIQERAPGSKLAERAARSLADFYYDRRDMRMASTMYDIYLRNHPNAADHAEAMQRLIFSHLGTFRGPKFDTSGLREATGWLGVLESRHPAEAQQIGAAGLRTRIEEAQAERMLVDAQWYLRRRDPVAARFILDRLVSRHGGTLAAQQGYEIMKERGWVHEDEPAELPVEAHVQQHETQEEMQEEETP